MPWRDRLAHAQAHFLLASASKWGGARRPQSNGICERFHCTLQEEFYATAFRKKLYTSLEELQADLDLWLAEYNQTRPHSGKYCYGKTPMQTFLDSVPLAREKMLDSLLTPAPEPERSPAVAVDGRITLFSKTEGFFTTMPVDQERTQSLFRKLGQLARKLTSDPQPEDVHQFRTTTRRVETLFGELVPKPGRNERKLLKQLAKIRKRAGRVRDLDVQMAALRTLKIGRNDEEKSTLLSALATDRARYEKKLVFLSEEERFQTLRKRLRRAAKGSHLYESKIDPVGKALRMFAQLSSKQGEVAEAALHQYRLRCKRIRYLAEMAGKEPLAEAVVEQLKAIQDAVGEWHDWDTLTLRAEALFSDIPNAPIVTALRAVRHSKLVEAMHATQAAKTKLLDMRAQPSRRKKPARSAVAQPSDEPALASATSA